jgi:hypothetical protein
MNRVHLLLLVALLTGCDEEASPPGGDGGVALRCAVSEPLRRPWFGDLHVHTAASLDANLQGTRLTVRDAYRFARGERIGIQPYDDEGNATRTVQLARPLDFAAVTDHAEFLGTIGACEDPTSAAYETDGCVQFREQPDQAFLFLNAAVARPPQAVGPPRLCGVDGVDCIGPARDVWAELRDVAAAAEDRSDACAFTTFVGYEWTGNPAAENLHRNVLFANDDVPELPASYFEEPYVEGLWAALRRDCVDAEGDCDALTIPHNSNLSAERMFDEARRDGSPFDAAYAAERHAFEPLLEVFQHKGSSECLPGGTTGDPDCAFEVLPYRNLSQPVLRVFQDSSEPSYARWALGRGIALEETLGANPFQYGFIGSTDTHIAAPGLVDEDEAFPGHGGAGSNNRDVVDGLPDVVEFNPGGLAVLWAEENSRASLFAAMRRREAYGTSGPRITLRFFGGSTFDAALCDGDADALAEAGYRDGVPMGGTLEGLSGAPTFVVSALRDPGTEARPGGLLQRIQIVRGWVDAEGVPQAEVVDVAGGPNEASVDEATCEVSGPGADRLCAVWTDPAPRPNAYYYARVLENPSCRWTTPLCRDVDCEGDVPSGLAQCCNDTYAATVQERAWSSPIWVRPPAP